MHGFRPIEQRGIHRYLLRAEEDDYAFKVPFFVCVSGMHVITKRIRTPSERLAATFPRGWDADVCCRKVSNGKTTAEQDVDRSVGQKWGIDEWLAG